MADSSSECECALTKITTPDLLGAVGHHIEEGVRPANSSFYEFRDGMQAERDLHDLTAEQIIDVVGHAPRIDKRIKPVPELRGSHAAQCRIERPIRRCWLRGRSREG